MRTPKAAKTEATKKKQHTQHIIFISCHPLSFRSIAVCICVRTAILHRCSHLAFIPPSCIGVRTLQVSIAARCFDVFCLLYISLHNGEDALRMREADPPLHKSGIEDCGGCAQVHQGRQMFGMHRWEIQGPPLQGITEYEARRRAVNCGRL